LLAYFRTFQFAAINLKICIVFSRSTSQQWSWWYVAPSVAVSWTCHCLRSVIFSSQVTLLHPLLGQPHQQWSVTQC